MNPVPTPVPLSPTDLEVELDALLTRAGLAPLPVDTRAEVLWEYSVFRAATARLRQGLPASAEPSSVFRPQDFVYRKR